MTFYRSGAMLKPAHGTNGHAGALLTLDPPTWRCQRCYTVAIGNDAWRAVVAAGWCTGALAALAPAAADIDDVEEDLVDVEQWDDVEAVAHAVRSVFDIGAAAKLSRLADRHGWKDTARAAEIEHERYDLRRDTEHRYGHAAALDLLDIAPAPAAPPATVDGQLSLFEAAS